MKTCTKCKLEKPQCEFGKNSAKPDGINTKCKACIAEYYAENRDRKVKYQSDYREANRDQINKGKAAWYAANKEQQASYRAANKKRIAERKAAYQASNPEKRAASHRNRHARKIEAQGLHNSCDIRRIFEHQRGLCANCHKKLFKSGKQKYHVDHIMPLALGGSNWPSNLQCLCSLCNMRKHAKDPIAWAHENGRLL